MEVGVINTESENLPENRAQADNLIKKWQVWPGSNNFYCDGKLMTGPDLRFLYLTLFLIGASVVQFCFAIIPVIEEQMLPWLKILISALLFLVIYNFFQAAFTNPGIISRGDAKTRHPPFGNIREVEMKGQILSSKWCYTCNIYRPLRAKHCSVCDNCVAKFDHHCPWLGNCIGERNYRYFFFFLLSIFLYVLVLLLLSLRALIVLKEKQNEGGDNSFFITLINHSSLTAIFIFALIAIIPIVSLLFFHFHLVKNNITSNEDVNGIFEEITNPYNNGCLTNCNDILFKKARHEEIDMGEEVNSEEAIAKLKIWNRKKKLRHRVIYGKDKPGSSRRVMTSVLEEIEENKKGCCRKGCFKKGKKERLLDAEERRGRKRKEKKEEERKEDFDVEEDYDRDQVFDLGNNDHEALREEGRINKDGDGLLLGEEMEKRDKEDAWIDGQSDCNLVDLYKANRRKSSTFGSSRLSHHGGMIYSQRREGSEQGERRERRMWSNRGEMGESNREDHGERSLGERVQTSSMYSYPHATSNYHSSYYY